MSKSKSEIFKSVGVEIRLFDPEDYLVVKETLTRLGVSPKGQKILYQSCHIVHKDGVYVIASFKELFALDGLPSKVSPEDIQRRNAIIKLLSEWELLEVVNKEDIADAMPLSGFKILKFSEKGDWQLVRKFNPANLVDFFDSE